MTPRIQTIPAAASPVSRHPVRPLLRRLGLVVVALLPALVLLSALSNVGLRARSQVVERLPAVEKARLAEATHLRQVSGNSVWPGWGTAEIPLIVYNEEYAFLVGYEEPPPGWRTVPCNELQGGTWERVPDDDFYGEPYYRQLLPEGIRPQAFTVRVSERSVASLPTMEWMKISLREEIRQQVPGFLAPIVPYRVLDRVFVGSSDWYIAALLHESFHSFQDIVAPTDLAAAEQAARHYEDQYPWEDEALQAAWQAELALLADAMRAPTTGARRYAQQFLALREQRRAAHHLSPALVRYEQQREWVEGIAKYAEMAIWREAASDNYEPLASITGDPWFKGYKGTFEQRWSQGVEQIHRMAGDEGDGRFYYSGWAQAVLLDRLVPEWKEKGLHGVLSMETLLRDAVQ